MWITNKGIKSTEIDDIVVRCILNLYPEEQLEQRQHFQGAFSNNEMEFKTFKEETEKILIPWQMFFLNKENFYKQAANISDQRENKVSKKLLSKRCGIGDITSKRIIDRLIRQQNYVTKTNSFNFPVNIFCNSLKDKQIKSAARHLLAYFEIDIDRVRKLRSKDSALKYFIQQVEEKNINVSRGVLTNKILPNHQVVPSEVYKNTSGFVIKDDCLPFIFLPSETNPDEVEGRQIYTLVFLLIVIGLGEYDYSLDKNFITKMLNAKNMLQQINNITSEVLMPAVKTDKLRGQNLTTTIRDELALDFKVSPLALIVTLKIRGIITQKQYAKLKPPKFTPKKQYDGPRRSQKVSIPEFEMIHYQAFRLNI